MTFSFAAQERRAARVLTLLLYRLVREPRAPLTEDTRAPGNRGNKVGFLIDRVAA